MLQGEFLERRDWTGRGGAPLKLLGKLTWRPDEDARAAATPRAKDGSPLTRNVRAAEATGASSARLDFTLHSSDGAHSGGGSEYLDFVLVNDVPVAARYLVVTGSGASFSPLSTRPIARIGPVDHPPITVRRAGKGLFAIDIEGVPSARILVHTKKWSTAIGEALAGSLGADTGDESNETEPTEDVSAPTEKGTQQEGGQE